MKSRTGFIALAIVLCGLASGCGKSAEIPDLTEEQQAQVVEYATGLLLKYDTKNDHKLLTDEELAAGIAEAEALKAKEEEKAARKAEREAKEEADRLAKEAEKAESSSAADSVTISNQSIADFYALSNIEVQYTGNVITDFYPDETTSDDYYFVVNATENHKLLVLKFQVQNTGSEDATIDMVSQKAAFAVQINSGTTQNALLTMILNDLCNYKGTLAAGESTELVLVFELPTEETANISSISLNMKNVDSSATISLQ